jgi:hypothetical protein
MDDLPLKKDSLKAQAILFIDSVSDDDPRLSRFECFLAGMMTAGPSEIEQVKQMAQRPFDDNHCCDDHD